MFEHARAWTRAAVVRHSKVIAAPAQRRAPAIGGRPRLLCLLRLCDLRLRRLRLRSRPTSLAAAHTPMTRHEGRGQAAPHARATHKPRARARPRAVHQARRARQKEAGQAALSCAWGLHGSGAAWPQGIVCDGARRTWAAGVGGGVAGAAGAAGGPGTGIAPGVLVGANTGVLNTPGGSVGCSVASGANRFLMSVKLGATASACGAR